MTGAIVGVAALASWAATLQDGLHVMGADERPEPTQVQRVGGVGGESVCTADAARTAWWVML